MGVGTYIDVGEEIPVLAGRETAVAVLGLLATGEP